MINKTARDPGLYFAGTVEEKLGLAQRVYRIHAHEILEYENIKKTLSRLSGYEKALSRQMNLMDMGSRCTACAAKSGGCCSAYMAGNTDAILLLINMLMGVDVVYHHDKEEENCCFLGKSGCILTIKPIFCLNYSCLQIHESYSAGQMQQLEKLTGQLLGEHIIIEGLILEKL